MKYVIGIDLGTTGLKTVIFSREGDVVGSAYREYPLSQPKNGWAEQDPELWWIAAKETVNEALSESGIAAENIVSLGISGQMHGLVMLDENCDVIRPAILWCDQRTGEECEDITNIIGKERLIEITANPALTGFTASKIMWVKKHEKENFDKCRHILLPKDYLRFRLSGDFATDVSDASGMQLLDVKNRCWSDEVVEKLGIDKSLLAKVYESVEVTGHVSAEASKETGLSEETLIVAGAGDNAAAAVGTAVIRDGKAFTTIGTSGVVFVHTDEPKIDPMGRVHTFCCAVPDKWHVMGVTQAAGLSLQWFKNQFCLAETEESIAKNEDVYKITDEKAAGIPIGAEKLFYLPYLMGERTPHLDPDCRGVFFGISAMHTRAHFIRAVMEGVGYSLMDCLKVLDGMGINPDSMLVTGGGGKSKLWKEMLGDMFRLKIKTIQSKEGPALGVAVLAAVGAGLYKDIYEAADTMVKYSDKEYLPVSENSEKYSKNFALYSKLYSSLKDNYKELASL